MTPTELRRLGQTADRLYAKRVGSLANPSLAAACVEATVASLFSALDNDVLDRWSHGLRCREIAAATGRTEGQINTIITRARRNNDERATMRYTGSVSFDPKVQAARSARKPCDKRYRAKRHGSTLKSSAGLATKS